MRAAPRSTARAVEAGRERDDVEAEGQQARTDDLNCPWDARALRTVIDETLDAHTPVGAPATWVLSNHDVTRHVTRYGRADTSFGPALRQLPGSCCLYQGEELGLWEVEDIPDRMRQDPIYHRTGGSDHLPADTAVWPRR
ncbi:MAG: alpha-amylase family glycosyl hydrolase [Actinoallomurus sp.]